MDLLLDQAVLRARRLRSLWARLVALDQCLPVPVRRVSLQIVLLILAHVLVLIVDELIRTVVLVVGTGRALQVLVLLVRVDVGLVVFVDVGAGVVVAAPLFRGLLLACTCVEVRLSFGLLDSGRLLNRLLVFQLEALARPWLAWPPG